MTGMIKAADLFCGCGGTSAGLYDAADELGVIVDLLAINHWDIAIDTHTQNHTSASHLCENLDNVNPREVVPGGKLNILVASPECTHHSNARGGKPRSDQSRASAWHVLRWLEALQVNSLLMENVPEFRSWGPLGCNGKPLKSKKGQTYKAFMNAVASLGYIVEDTVLNAADYGDATARKRLFVMAKKGNNKRITWPEASHGPNCPEPYRTAREIIDWDYPSQSIFERKRPLAANTMRRIEAGLRKFGGEAFLATLRGGGSRDTAQSVDGPVPTISANGTHVGVCEPFILHQMEAGGCKSVDGPLPTVTTKCGHALVQPFIVPQFSDGAPRSVDRPLGTITTTSRGMALVQPFLMAIDNASTKDTASSVDEPTPTIIASNQRLGLVQPFLVNMKGQSNASDIDKPMPTQTTSKHMYLCEPEAFVMHTTHHGADDSRCHSSNDPLPCVTGAHRGEMALIEPFLTKFYGTGISKSVDRPLDTVGTRDTFGLVEAEPGGQYGIDIKFRMLQPHELAAAMSMEEMTLCGNKGDKVKQIGNAVPRKLAKALCLAALG